jgi:hypothetical protein
MKSSTRYMLQIMAHIGLLWVTHVHALAIAHDRQKACISTNAS